MFKPKEKIIQIEGQYYLTSKGNVYYMVDQAKGIWELVELPKFDTNTNLYKLIPGTTKFYEPVSPQQKFNDAKSVGDMLV